MSALHPFWESSPSSSPRGRLHGSCSCAASRGTCGSTGPGEAGIAVPFRCCADFGDQKLFSLLTQGAAPLPSEHQQGRLPRGEQCCCRSGTKAGSVDTWSIPPSLRKPLTPSPINAQMAPDDASYCPKATAIHQHHPILGAVTCWLQCCSKLWGCVQRNEI